MSFAGQLSKVLKNNFLARSNILNAGGLIARHSSIWEPDYLILGRTKTPEYDLINIQLKGYDFAVLEKYQKIIKKIAKIMRINVVKCWPAVQQDLEVHHYRKNSEDIEYKYNLAVCERNIQVVDVKSHIMALFAEAVITTCPPGVNLSFHPHEDEMEENRYIPNLTIVELQEELENVGSDKKKKKIAKK